MSSPPSKTVLITGATGGIGGALALAYAQPGVVLILHGRNQQRLDDLQHECSQRGSTVITKVMDLRDTPALISWLGDVSISHSLDLVIVNAGININVGADRQGEQWDDIQALLDINIKAAFATVQGVLPAMRTRKQGQIALVSSLAAYRGLPETPSYSASKAAVKAYGEGLRDWLAKDGVKVNVIMPGYVESQMCSAMPGPKLFLWSAEKAAKTIRRGLALNRARISFPFPLNLGCWFLGIAHPAVSSRILRWLNYGA